MFRSQGLYVCVTILLNWILGLKPPAFLQQNTPILSLKSCLFVLVPAPFPSNNLLRIYNPGNSKKTVLREDHSKQNWGEAGLSE